MSLESLSKDNLGQVMSYKPTVVPHQRNSFRMTLSGEGPSSMAFRLGIRVKGHQEPAGLFCTQHGVTTQQVGTLGSSNSKFNHLLAVFFFFSLLRGSGQ